MKAPKSTACCWCPECLSENPETKANLERLDALWLKLAGHPLSPLDWPYIEALFTGGIPMGAIAQGIIQTFHNYQRVPRTRPIRNFSYCLQEIVRAHQELQQLKTQLNPALYAAYLDSLAKGVERMLR